MIIVHEVAGLSFRTVNTFLGKENYQNGYQKQLRLLKAPSIITSFQATGENHPPKNWKSSKNVKKVKFTLRNLSTCINCLHLEESCLLLIAERSFW